MFATRKGPYTEKLCRTLLGVAALLLVCPMGAAGQELSFSAFSTGLRPAGVGFASGGYYSLGNVVVANSGEDSVSLFSIGPFSVGGTIRGIPAPQGVVFCGAGSEGASRFNLGC